MPLTSIEKHFSEFLENQKQKGSYREIQILPFSQNSDVIDFASNDYLNLRTDPEVIESGCSAAQKYGAGSGASRLVLETNELIQDLENYIASQLEFNSALFFPSGFVANVSFFDVFSEFHDIEFFIDHRAHASLFFGLRASKAPFQVFKHDDFEHLAKKLNSSQKTMKIIVVESIHSTDGTILNGGALKNICAKFNASIFLDDTHGFGILGDGKGFLNLYPELRPYTFAVSIGCGKAVGVSGGFLVSSSLLFKDYLIQNSKHLMFSTGISPFIIGATFRALKKIFSKEGDCKRMLLYANIKNCVDFIQQKNNLCLHQTPIVPILLNSNKAAINASKALINQGLIIKSLRPPSVPRKTSRLRISLKSSHTSENLERLCKSLKYVLDW